jgi:mannose-6-phosphate isomerase-like protein (cupin superfamily)
MTIIHETEVPEVEHPGRFMRWLANQDSLPAKNLSVCVIRVLPGETVRPAHSHPNSEELIYIITGSGKVMIENEVGEVKSGSAYFSNRAKFICLRTPVMISNLLFSNSQCDNYKTFDDIVFPDNSSIKIL